VAPYCQQLRCRHVNGFLGWGEERDSRKTILSTWDSSFHIREDLGMNKAMKGRRDWQALHFGCGVLGSHTMHDIQVNSEPFLRGWFSLAVDWLLSP